ncbi:Flp family type IVb pilin [Ammoniphilus sp. 3BR4]|uniref:Flp family type IVb pilin n=1 Tax=Ammoniphilus sp. 3BR4 TaxID=3158265 RepID=UPI003464EE79
MMNFVKRLVREEEGQGMVEYGLILGLIVVGAIVAMGPLGTKITALFNKVNTAVTTPAS